jgi:hypothetical protein
MELCLLFLIYVTLFSQSSLVKWRIEYDREKFYQPQQRDGGKQLLVFDKELFSFLIFGSFQEHVEHQYFLF